MTTETANVLIIGFMEVAAEDRDAFAAELHDSVRKTLGKPGCVFYDFSSDVVNPNLFRMAEGWRDDEALMAHLQSPDFQQTMQRAQQLKIVGRSVQKYTVTDRADLPLPPTV